MIKISFLKKDEMAKKIYRTIWENRNLWYLPKRKELGGHFHGFHNYQTETQLFIYEGDFYIDRDITHHVLINKPEYPPAFTDDEIYSIVAIEKVDFQRQKGQGKFLTEENLDKRFELIEIVNPFDENCELNPLVKLMAMHKTIMDEIEKRKDKDQDGGTL